MKGASSTMSTQSDRDSPVSLSSFSGPLLSIGSPSVLPLSPQGDLSSGTIYHTRKIHKGHRKKKQNGSTQGRSHSTTIGTLPDDVLLEIFDFYRKNHNYNSNPVWKWHLLAHVCQTWRQLTFASPHRLDLKILCTYGIPIRKSLAIWPAFPIVIRYERSWTRIRDDDEENIIFALKHHDRVCSVELDPGLNWSSRSEEFDAAVQESFPILKRLYINATYRDVPALPPNFLGGSAPSLQAIYIDGTPFPALPTLLLSTSDLVKLDLRSIPPTGYISPEMMVASLATLPKLDHFYIGFQSATPRPDIHLPPVSRTVLPALTSFEFCGASEYLEDLISQIDGPKINQITITYRRLVDYQVTQLSKFINRSLGPMLTLPRRARVHFSGYDLGFSVCPRVNRPPLDWHPHEVHISCEGFGFRALDIARLLDHFRTSLSNVVYLDIDACLPPGPVEDRTRNVDWLHLFHQFPTVQLLRSGRRLARRVALALDDIPGELVAEVLPSLDFICLVDQPASSIEKFIVARRLSGRPVIVVDTETEFDQRLESYVSI